MITVGIYISSDNKKPFIFSEGSLSMRKKISDDYQKDLLALRNVAEAQGFAALAKKTGRMGVTHH